METKKSLKANLERGRLTNFMLGLVVALAVLFTGFEWGNNELNINTNYIAGTGGGEIVEVFPPISFPEPPEPPKPEVLKTPEVLVIVDVAVEPAKIEPTEGFSDAPQPVYTPSAIIEDNEVEPTEDFIFISAEVMPEFPGGEVALIRWIAENVTYPAVAANNGIGGRVSCTFVVNTDGSISNVQVIRPIDPSLDKEAVRVLQSMPKWKPGMQRGKPVRVKFSVPVRFKLQK